MFCENPLWDAFILSLLQRIQGFVMCRLAHPGGPMKTNKAAALAKFLERKLQEPNGLASVDLKLVELAVKNAKQTVQCSKFLTFASLTSKLKILVEVCFSWELFSFTWFCDGNARLSRICVGFEDFGEVYLELRNALPIFYSRMHCCWMQLCLQLPGFHVFTVFLPSPFHALMPVLQIASKLNPKSSILGSFFSFMWLSMDFKTYQWFLHGKITWHLIDMLNIIVHLELLRWTISFIHCRCLQKLFLV